MIYWLIIHIYNFIYYYYFYFIKKNKLSRIEYNIVNKLLTNYKINIHKYEIILEYINKNSILLSEKTNNHENSILPIDYSNVYLYKNCVWKFIKDEKNYINSYYNLILDIKNKNISSVLLPLFILKDNKYIIEKFKYYPNTDLFDIISNKIQLNKLNKLYLIKSIIESLADIHNNGYAHRDIKLENILYFKNKALFIDLVMANRYNNMDSYSGGTFAYAAPELYYKNNMIIDWRIIDIWSLGIVIYAIIFEELPWNDAIDCSLYRKYYKKLQKYKTDYYWNYYDIKSIYKILLSRTLEIDYTKRSNINQLLEMVNNYIKKK